MSFISSPSIHTTSIRHHDRGLTLVFGPDGQVSLVGFDSGIASQALHTPTASNTGAPTPGTHSLLGESTSVSPIPNLEATSSSLNGTSFSTPTFTPTSTSISSSPASSSFDPSSTATDTDTNLPAIPTVNYPTPSPTPVSNPKDHGIGAPFYLAIVLASISFIGCVSAFIAWCIRSRTRRRPLEFDDPWIHRDIISDAEKTFTDNANGSEKGGKMHGKTHTKRHYLPASIVRRNSSNLLGVPHTIPALEDGTRQNGTSSAGQHRSLRRANEPRSQKFGSERNPYSRPGAERLQTGLSVQESTRTLGRLRVANRVPGDVTSGDEGGVNVSRPRNAARLTPAANTGVPATTTGGESSIQNTRPGLGDRSVPEGDGPLGPPGPATLSWGRRTDTVAALRRTRRRTPGTNIQADNNPGYCGSLYPTQDRGPSTAVSQAQSAIGRGENGAAHAHPQPDVLNWKSTLRSSFWQAVDAMTGNRPSDIEPRAENGGSGSTFTPAPQRVASRRSPVSPIRPTTSTTLHDTSFVPLQETENKYDLILSDKSDATQEMLQNSTHSRFGTSMAISDSSLPPRESHLTRNLGTSARRHLPDSHRTDTGSLYSTDSAAARANLRKYGYEDPIPSSWSALGRARESQLDLDHMYLPLPRSMLSSSPGPLSITPSQLTFESGLLSSSVSTHTRTRTPIQSESDLIGSDANTWRSSKTATTASCGVTTSSMYSVSRNGTVQSGRGTIGHGSLPSHSSSMLSRKKGVSRKRPRPPPRTTSTASSVQSIESRLSTRDVAVRRALLERRRKVKAAESLQSRENSLLRSRDESNLLV